MLNKLKKINYKIMKTITSSKGNVKENLLCPDLTLSMTKEKISKRAELFEKYLTNQNQNLEKFEKKEISITLPDGKVIKGKAYETTPLSIARGISKKLAMRVCVAKVTYTNRYSNYFGKIVDCDEEEENEEEKNLKSELMDLGLFLEGDCKLELLDFDSKEGKETFWHSSAHVLGKSIEENFEGFLTHGPPLTDGFFYDSFMGDKKIHPENYQALEKSAQNLVSKKVKFQKLLLTKQEALELFQDNPFKVALIKAKIGENDKTSAYKCGDLIDLCTGPHLDTTGKIKAFKINSTSSAYWLGKQNLDDLQRIYAITFPSKKQLKQHITLIEELKKKDHRILGEKQKLFTFSPISPGCTFFLPHGTRIFNRLVDLMRHEYIFRGFTEVNTPTMFKNALWKTSGHYFKYKDDMYFVKTKDEEFGIKPMNCPSHCVMFGTMLRSYRDLPVRYADFGVLHRNEISGALSGLTRVRKFHQDDAHIFCRPDQIEEEIKSQLEFITYIYSIFGFEFSLELSTRPDNYLGTIEMWDDAENGLKGALNLFGKPWKLNPKDGAFYGPKIDIKVQDCYKRKHQLGTIQLDFNLPIRFNLQYKTKSTVKKEENEKNEKKEKKDHKKVHKKEHKKEEKKKEFIKEDKNENQQKSDCKKGECDKEEIKEEKKDYIVGGELKKGFERPLIVHRAILGSLERCMAILIEHYGGKWPFWLSPRQIAIIPVSEKTQAYAEKLRNKLLLKNYHVDLDDSNFTLNKRIRNNQLEQYNYILVVGEKEQLNKSVNVRERDCKKPLGEMSLEKLFSLLRSKHLKKSNAEINCELSGLLNSDDALEELKKMQIDLKMLEEWNRDLENKSFFGGEGFVCGDEDKERYGKLKGVDLDLSSLQNLNRWFKTCAKCCC